MTTHTKEYKPECSVIILNYNGANYTIDCYKSIINQTFTDKEIIIIDNASTDDSLKHIERECPEARIIKHSINEGTGGGFAVGANHANGELIFFLCNDTELDPDVIEKMTTLMNSRSDCGACGAKHVYYDNPETIELMGYVPDKFGVQHCFGSNQPDNGVDNITEAWISGTVFMVRRSVYDLVGGYDPVHFTLNDEVDLCWRISIHGYAMLICESARVKHHHFATLRFENRSKCRFWAERHLLRTLLKNYSGLTLCRILPQYLFIQMFEILYLSIQGLFGMVWSDIRAVIWNINMLPNTWRHHRRIQKTRTVSDREFQKKLWSGCVKFQWGLQLLCKGKVFRNSLE